MTIEDQIALIEKRMVILEELQRQLSELQGRESSFDADLVNEFIQRTNQQVHAVEKSLDRGVVTLPKKVLARPDIEQKEIKLPDVDRTPYSDGIDQIDNFFDDVKDSELAKKGTRDFAEAFVKAQVLPHHLEEMGRLSQE